MQPLRIALLQMAGCGPDAEAAATKGARFCRLARESGADIALFPEMWSNGYTATDPRVWAPTYDPLDLDAEGRRLRAEWQAQALPLDGWFVAGFSELARELEMAIAVTLLERHPGAPRNTMVLLDRRGTVALTYAKVHTCDFSLEAACAPGERFEVCLLDTAAGPVRVGAMICYDREFPESARVLMLEGAELVLVPNACEIERHRRGQLRARAFENMVALAMTNYAMPDANGRSTVVSPQCFDHDAKSLDNVLVEAGSDEGVVIADLDLAALRDYRRREAWGNAYRKPRAYGTLTSEEVRPPFVRPDSRR
ncbi:MAG: carbon-nitrogen hydrolase family protein [Anaerolineae bacterium]